MDATQIFRHKDYELTCSARAVDSGRFAPTLTLCKQVWPTRPREIAVARGEHMTAEAAIAAAHAQGLEWITNYG